MQLDAEQRRALDSVLLAWRKRKRPISTLLKQTHDHCSRYAANRRGCPEGAESSVGAGQLTAVLMQLRMGFKRHQARGKCDACLLQKLAVLSQTLRRPFRSPLHPFILS